MRTYNSAVSNRARYDLAAQWSIDINRKLVFNSPSIPTVGAAVRPDGKAFTFILQSGVWKLDADINDALTQLKSGTTTTGWRYIIGTENAQEEYDADGLLLRVIDKNRQFQNYSYSDGVGGVLYGVTAQTNGYLAPVCNRPAGFSTPTTARVLLCVTDTQGRQLNFNYDASGHINQFADPLGQITQYGFDANNNLSAVTYPDGKTKTYLYENVTYKNVLTGIVDENGIRYITYGYNSTRKAISESLSGGADAASLSFGTNATTLTDALGTQRTYNFQTVLGVTKSTGASQPGGSACSASSSSISYDANGNVASRADFNGDKTCYGYDTTRNLETRRVEGLASSAVCSTVLTTPPAPTSANPVRTASTQWHGYWRLPVQVAQPLKLTTYVYNGDTYGGNVISCEATGASVPSINGGTQPIGVLCQKIEQATTDTTGSAGLSSTPTGTARTWMYTYNQYGQVLTANGPRTDVSDVTTYTYYAANDATLGKRGNLATVTNALGQVTSITSYDANGRPLTLVDPNSVTTTLTYDPRGRLTSKTVGGEATTYQYDGVGQLTKVTLPDSSYLSYTYDAAHRMTGITDTLGNQILYTLDALGNRTLENIKDPANQLAQTRSRVFDALNRLYQDIGASSQTTTYAYDANGNLTGITDPLSHLTTNGYDALNRLIQITDPNNGHTQLAYNGQDRTTQITDPRSLATSYALDGLGNLSQQQSLDTGTTQSTYDPAGNLLTRTDAKGQVTSYAYDALNRVTLITFNDGSKQNYTYDTGTNGVGRLASITETNPSNAVTGILAYAYDALGRVLSETRTINGVAYTTGYQYNNGRLVAMIYPSGKRLDYSLDAQGRISQIQLIDGSTVKVLAAYIQYHPFGGVKSWTNGAGQTYSRAIDQDGRITSYTLGAQTWQIGYDAASRITYFTDAANAANTASYGYDILDRLTGATLPSINFGYGYDANGNRTGQTIGANTYTYTTGATSNRLTGINTAPPKSYSFDANGSITSDGANTYSYDTRGRLVQAQTVAGTTSYRVNVLGQRDRKTGSTTDTVYLYDLSGHLIVEATASGQIQKEYVYENDEPLVQFSGSSIYYIQADHLGTPRLITDEANNAVWRNLPTTEPFGVTPPEEDPNNTGTYFKFNLRASRYYSDIETGTFYAYLRDCYDPLSGRFCEVDPIGLAGGINPYVYVNNDPLIYIDPRGTQVVIPITPPPIVGP